MSTLIKELEQTATGQRPMPKIKQEDGSYYYDELPPGTRVASIENFYDHNGNYYPGMAYLIHSELTPGRYDAKRTKTDFQNHNDFYTFLKRGRIYVFENSTK